MLEGWRRASRRASTSAPARTDLLVSSGFLPPFRINLGYEKFDLKDAILGGATGESTILSGVAALSFNLFQLGPVRPYVVAGLGAFNIKDVLESAGGEAETSSTHFGIDGGAGLALRIGRIEGFIEGRVQNVYTEAGVVDAKNIRAIPVTFGILFGYPLVGGGRRAGARPRGRRPASFRLSPGDRTEGRGGFGQPFRFAVPWRRPGIPL